MNASKYILTLTLVGITLSGCGGARSPMSDRKSRHSQEQAESPEPAAEPSSEAQADPPAETSVPGKQKHETVRVFYGTDRNLTGSTYPKQFFGAERASLSLGFCDVSIPKNHSYSLPNQVCSMLAEHRREDIPPGLIATFHTAQL